MTDNDANSGLAASTPCRRAEAKAAANPAAGMETLSPEAAQQVLHELQVHQIELDLQNEELRRAQVELEASQARYFDLYDLAPVGYVMLSETGQILEANLTAASLLGQTRAALVKQPLTRFIFPADQDIYYRQRKQLLATDAPQACELRLTPANASPFWAQLKMTHAPGADGKPTCLAVISDVTARKQAEEQLRQQVQTHDHEQAQLLQISHALASTLEFQPGVFLEQLQELVACTQVGLFALEDPVLLVVAMCGGPHLGQARPIRVHLKGREILTALFDEHQPICIADVWSDTPPAQFLRSLHAHGAAVLLEGMRSWMWVPLEAKDRLLGALGLAHAQPNFFTPHHADLALRAAYQAAVAMINAELYGHAQALAVLEERQRLAHSLHDAVNQSLFSAGLIAEVLPRLWERDQAEARRSIQDLVRLTRGAQAEMRALLAELRPSTLIDSNLGDLLRLLGNAFSGRTNLPITVAVAGDFIPPSDVQVAFYRVCQEALINIGKHANASCVEVYLSQQEAMVELRIRDDGQGFDPTATFPGHYGLCMMRERAEAVGALLSITSQPGHSTELILRWTQTSPLEAL